MPAHAQAKLKAELQQRFGSNVRLTVKVGETSGGSVAAARSREQAKRQANAAEAWFGELEDGESAPAAVVEESEAWMMELGQPAVSAPPERETSLNELPDAIPEAVSDPVADDIAESVEKIKKHCGGICIEPFDAPGVGKISVVNDPSGIPFSIIQFV